MVAAAMNTFPQSRVAAAAPCSRPVVGNHAAMPPIAAPAPFSSFARRVTSQTQIARRSTQARAAPGVSQGSAGMAPELRQAIEEYLAANKVVLFMKGTKQFPQCGFSNTCVQILQSVNAPFEGVNILEDESLRSGMKEFSQWPTFPQLYIGGEFVGGCDIMIDMYQSGELQEALEVALNS